MRRNSSFSDLCFSCNGSRSDVALVRFSVRDIRMLRIEE